MSLDTLTQTIGDIRDRLGRGEYRDEAKVSQGIVMRVLQDLGWPVFDTGVVAREYSIGGRRVDYALIGKFGKPAVLLEVKRVGRIEIGEGQLFEYAFHGGAPIVVLTDGRNWWLYFTFGQGDHRDRRFAEVDLQDGDPNRNADLFVRYLQREAVLDGEARRRAEADLEVRWKQRTAEEAIPVVWNRILDEADGPLARLIREGVEAECGVSPSEDSVRRFLRQVPVHRDPPLPPMPAPAPKPSGSKGHPFSLTMDGQVRTYPSAAKVLVAALSALSKRHPTFLERFAAEVSQKRIGRDDGASPGAGASVHPLPGGWWINTNMLNRQKEQLVRQACEVAGVQYGTDLSVALPPVRHGAKAQS